MSSQRARPRSSILILNILDDLVDAGTATAEAVTPLLQGVVDALNTATSSFGELTPIESPAEGVEDQVADAISGVYTVSPALTTSPDSSSQTAIASRQHRR